jgi:hypothetical protein
MGTVSAVPPGRESRSIRRPGVGNAGLFSDVATGQNYSIYCNAQRSRHADWPLVPGLYMLRDGEDVAVGILEPCDFVAGWGDPDSEFVLLEEAENFEVHSFRGKPTHYLLDI